MEDLKGLFFVPSFLWNPGKWRRVPDLRVSGPGTDQSLKVLIQDKRLPGDSPLDLEEDHPPGSG